jgi:hypothetical protein
VRLWNAFLRKYEPHTGIVVRGGLQWSGCCGVGELPGMQG